MTGVAEGLEILNVETRSALIDGNDVIDHLGGCQATRFEALLAHRLLLQLHSTQPSPGSTLVELGVVVAVASERLALGLPRAVYTSFQLRHISR